MCAYIYWLSSIFIFIRSQYYAIMQFYYILINGYGCDFILNFTQPRPYQQVMHFKTVSMKILIGIVITGPCRAKASNANCLLLYTRWFMAQYKYKFMRVLPLLNLIKWRFYQKKYIKYYTTAQFTVYIFVIYSE